MAFQDRAYQLGKEAERLVAEFLEFQGFEVLERNLRLGPLEVDLLAREGSVLVLVEVRARTSGA